MVQLRLPKNSRMQHGKAWPKPTTDPKTQDLADLPMEPGRPGKPTY